MKKKKEGKQLGCQHGCQKNAQDRGPSRSKRSSHTTKHETEEKSESEGRVETCKEQGWTPGREEAGAGQSTPLGWPPPNGQMLSCKGIRVNSDEFKF